MTEISRIWDGTSTGDAGSYSSSQWRELWRTQNYNSNQTNFTPIGWVTGSGASTSTVPLAITETSPASLGVRVDIGQYWMFGAWYYNDAAKTIAISPNSSGSTRIDSVILTMDWTAQTIRLSAKEGTPASGVPPTLTQTVGTLYEYEIARVTVANGAVSIVNANIVSTYNLPIRPVTHAYKSVTASLTPSSYNASWTGTQINAPDLLLAQWSNNNELGLSADAGTNWFPVHNWTKRSAYTTSGSVSGTSVYVTLGSNQTFTTTGGWFWCNAVLEVQGSAVGGTTQNLGGRVTVTIGATSYVFNGATTKALVGISGGATFTDRIVVPACGVFPCSIGELVTVAFEGLLQTGITLTWAIKMQALY